MSKTRKTLQIGGRSGGTYESLYSGCPPEIVAAWKHEPDKEGWSSRQYDQRWSLTNTLYPHVLCGDPRVRPMDWYHLRIALWWWKIAFPESCLEYIGPPDPKEQANEKIPDMDDLVDQEAAS